MVVDEKDMIKLENFDLEKPDTVSTSVEFPSVVHEEVKMEINFPSPKLKKQIKIENVELDRHGTSGSKRKNLF